MMELPVLYSYRRCPYAMRARLALQICHIDVEIREISLSRKPEQLLQASPKGTVPVLVLKNGFVIEQSLEIMNWAFDQNPLHQMPLNEGNFFNNLIFNKFNLDENKLCDQLIATNDDEFKRALDGYKYPERNLQTDLKAGLQANLQDSQLFYRNHCENILQGLENLLHKNIFLINSNPSLADIAIFPFIRQFAAVDNVWFDHTSYPKLKIWLNYWLNSSLFASIMKKQPTYFG